MADKTHQQDPAERIAWLLFRQLQGMLTVEEKAELENWQEQFPEQAGIAADITGQSYLQSGIKKLQLAKQAIDQGLLVNGVPLVQEELPARHIPFIRRWGWAAAVLLLALGAAWWLWLRPVVPDHSLAGNPVLNPEEILPGGNRAMLTLADGSVIYLDSSANGTIADQGGASVIKLADGQLGYEIKKEAAGSPSITNTMRTPKGGQYQLILPDGSKVWLNAASSITYPVVFSGNERQVFVSGEAYFEIAPHSKAPFVVKVSGGQDITVLGTRFNISSYSNDPRITTTLLQGKVRVKAFDETVQQAYSVVLLPGQQCAGAREEHAETQPGQSLQVNYNADMDKVMAWKNGVFDFDGIELKDAMKQLERWYDLEVFYESGVPDLKFGGKLSRKMNLGQLLSALERTGVHFRLEEGRRLIVLPG